MKLNKETLYRLYVVETRTCKEIANIFGYKSCQTIANKLKKFGIAIRSKREAQRCYEPTREEIINLYCVKKYSIEDIAKMKKSSYTSIRNKLKEFSIKVRNKTWKCAGWNKDKKMPYEVRRRISKAVLRRYKNGRLHWNKGNHWPEEIRMKISKSLLNGHDPFPNNYGKHWNVYRTNRLIEDNYTCQQCGSTKHLEVHHWEPYRFNYNNELENLVTLCRNCHKGMHTMYKNEGFIKEIEEEIYSN